jgi:hypothetical protein
MDPISVTNEVVNFAGACKWALLSHSIKFTDNFVFHHAFINHCVSFQEIDRAPRKAAVWTFSFAVGFMFRLSKDVPFIAEWIVLAAALNIVPSSNNHVPIVVHSATFPKVFAVFTTFNHCHIVFASLNVFINLTTFSIFVANFTHLLPLAARAAQRNAPAIAIVHIPQVTTATATVIAISLAISHAN